MEILRNSVISGLVINQPVVEPFAGIDNRLQVVGLMPILFGQLCGFIRGRAITNLDMFAMTLLIVRRVKLEPLNLIAAGLLQSVKSGIRHVGILARHN